MHAKFTQRKTPWTFHGVNAKPEATCAADFTVSTATAPSRYRDTRLAAAAKAAGAAHCTAWARTTDNMVNSRSFGQETMARSIANVVPICQTVAEGGSNSQFGFSQEEVALFRVAGT
jgi:membrane-bound lytic murein transglycosylase B